jgi:hypothetical protein
MFCGCTYYPFVCPPVLSLTLKLCNTHSHRQYTHYTHECTPKHTQTRTPTYPPPPTPPTHPHTHPHTHARVQEDEDWLVRAPLLSVWDDKYPTMPAAVGDDGYDGFGDGSGFNGWGTHPDQPAIMGPVCYLPARDQVSALC